VRWFAQEDADGAPPSLRWTAGIGLVGAGVTVAAVLAGPSSAPAPRGADTMPGAEQAVEPIGRAALPHTVRSTPPAAVPPVPSVAPAVAEDVTEAAATLPAQPAVPAGVVVALGSTCQLPGATAVTADGVPVVCAGGQGRSTPRWHRA
jgi:hypothetical protein